MNDSQSMQRRPMKFVCGAGVIVAAAASVVVWLSPASAGPVEDAQALFQQRKYADVDKVLEKDLSGKSPSAAALRVSLDSAIAQGKIVTASHRITALLKATENKDARLVYMGAEIADETGDTRMALVRYLAFARMTNDKSPELEKALEYVLKRETYPEEYKKFVKVFGNDALAWQYGQALLTRQIEVLDAEKVLDVADFLMQSFPDPEKVFWVHGTLRNAADSNVFGREPKDKFVRPLRVMAKYPPSDYTHLDYIVSNAAPTFSEVERYKLISDIQIAAGKRPLSAGLVQQFGNMRNLPTDDAKLAAGRAYLALEPQYAEAKDPSLYDYYLRTIGDSPQVFMIKDKVLVSGADEVRRWEAIKVKYPGSAIFAESHHLRSAEAYLAADPNAHIAFLRQNIAFLDAGSVAVLLQLTQNANTAAVISQAAAGHPYMDGLELRMQLLGNYNAAKDKDSLIATAREHMTAYPASFNVGQVQGQVMGSPLLTLPEKVAFSKEFIDKAGYSPAMKQMLDELAKDAANWGTKPEFQQLKAAFDAKPQGNDLGMRTAVALANITMNKAAPDASVFNIAKAFVDTIPAWPGGAERAKNVQELQAQNILDSHALHVWENPDAVQQLAQLWLPKGGTGTSWGAIINRLREQQRVAAIGQYIPMYIAKCKAANDKGDPAIWNQLGYFNMTKDPAVPSPFADAYAIAPPDWLAAYLFNQRIVPEITAPRVVAELQKLVTTPGVKLTDASTARQILSSIGQWAAPTFKMSPELIKTFYDVYAADVVKGGPLDPQSEAMTYGAYQKSGLDKEAAAFLAAMQEQIKTRTLEQQMEFFNCLWQWAAPPAEVAAKPELLPPEMPGFRKHMLLKVITPLMSKLQPRYFETLRIHGGMMIDLHPLLAITDEVAAKNPDAAQQKADAVLTGKWIVHLVSNGVRFEGSAEWMYPILDIMVRQSVEQGKTAETNRLLAFYGSLLPSSGTWETNYTSRILPLVTVLEEKGLSESVYAFTASMEKTGKLIDAPLKQMQIVKAKAAALIPGLIPVDASDPTYDLYRAAHALSLGDESKSWELTAPKIKLLTETWESYDSSYVAWSVDQMRKQKLYKESLDFAFKVLLREQDLSPDVAAAVSLTKGDIYKDMENFQAARIEYEALKNNAKYAKTEAGAQSVYRLVDLHIITKDYTAAEQILERLVDADNLQSQAEAYYLYAKMAYQQEQYKEAKDYLKKVRDRVLNHVQAALLEGELNLKLPGGLQNTEVAIGDPRLSTIVIPGRPLELKLQDQNLSVARGGSAIPVIITTSKGGDVEKANLLPSPSNKNLFTGQIATALGKAQKGNLTLELLGDDIVSYTIDPEFQKANDLHYPAKNLEVRSDARLAVSSGEILSEEEEEKRELERQMQRRLILQSRRLEQFRDGRTVRPGSPLYVQVTDFDRDLTDAPDKVKVDLNTASGDVLEGFELTETGPHTGIFRGAVPTGIPLPKAQASDTEEGKDPGATIREGDAAGWTSLADGKKPKWIEVDTMSSFEVSGASIELAGDPSSIREAVLQGLLSDDYTDIANIPARGPEATKGGLIVEVAPDQRGGTPEDFRRFIKQMSNATYLTTKVGFDRADTAQKTANGWQTARVRGTFWIPENQQLELKFLQPVSPENWQIVHVLIDGEPVLSNTVNEQTIKMTGKVDLAKGAHTLEILSRDHWQQSKVILGYRKPDGTFEAVPTDWFNVEKQPDLKKALESKGKIQIKGNVITGTFDKPMRLRKVRWLFNDFTGTSIAVKKFTVLDAAGKPIVPGKADFSSATKDNVLQIAPGDQITIGYRDDRRLRDDGQLITQQLNSSYANGTITLAEEKIETDPNNPNDRHSTYLEAKRCRPGDQLMVVVTDYDEDTTDARDTVDVTVSTSSGEKLMLKALETWTNRPDLDAHAGEFLAVLKIGDKTDKDTIKVAPGDKISVSYVDKENTNPGVPVDRTYALFEAGKQPASMLVYRTKVNMVPDESAEAKAKLKRILGKEKKDAFLMKPLVVARHPDYAPPVADASNAGGAASIAPPKTGTDDEIIASVAAPLLFEVTYPKAALNAGSALEVTAVAQSEIDAAKKAGRPPQLLTVPTYVQGIERMAQIKGYPIQLQSQVRRDDREMLRDGAFSGVIRLQVGSHGDTLDDLVVNSQQEFATEAEKQADKSGFYLRVPTLLVSGSDTVHLLIKDKDTGAITKAKIRLLSDARLELLDRTYTVESDQIHLGDKFFLRVTDPDHDTSDERDTINVKVASQSGDSMKLAMTETLPHSGVFTAVLEPQFVGEKGADGKVPPPKTDDYVLSVNFGDSVTVTYVDDLSLESQSPVTITKQGKILFGSDGQVATFTKKFKDPEIAVKTRFLMAESLFEMAKEHRKLTQKEQADEEIARGKRILEEAIRDYPDTSLAVQGEYLLANLAQELGNYQEAVGRYSNVISTWPDSEYSSQSQFKKALCFEKLENFDQAMEEYVKLTYVYPDNPLVADATVRLGNYYYKKQSFKIAGKIFYNFQQKNPTHKLAAEALFLAAQCDYKQNEFAGASKRFQKVVDDYPDEKDVRAEAMYWLADSMFKGNDQVKSYQTFKKLTWDYPDSKWAKIARGRLTEEVFSRMAEQENQ